MVEVSQYIDGSQIYGSNDDMAAKLRSFKNGKLRSDIRMGGNKKIMKQEFCPQINRTTLQCGTSTNSKVCFQAGKLILEKIIYYLHKT